MLNGTDYAQQTRAINAIDDETIRENDFNEIRRIVCYNQSIYDDIQLEDDEWLGLTLSVDRASVLTNVRPMYDQAAIMIQDNDRRNMMLIRNIVRPVRRLLKRGVTVHHLASNHTYFCKPHPFNKQTMPTSNINFFKVIGKANLLFPFYELGYF